MPVTQGRYAISAPLEFTIPGTELHHRNAQIRVADVATSGYNVDAPDCLITGKIIGSTTPLDVTGMTAPWEMSIVSSKWTAVNAYSNAHRLQVPYLEAEGFSSAVRVTDWDLATGARSVNGHVEDVSVGKLLCKNVEFGIVIHGTDRFSYESITGSYCCPIGGTRPPHMVYFSGTNADNVDVRGVYARAEWEGGAIPGQAFQFKGASGAFGALRARGCPGALNIMDSTGWTVDIESTGDTSVDAYGSVSISKTTGPEPTGTFIGFKVQMASNGIPYRALNGGGINFPNGMDVEVNHTTSGTAHDIEIRGTNCDVSGGIRHKNVGPSSWRAVGAYAGDGHRFGRTVIKDARVGVEVRATATNATFTHEPDITLHPTDGFVKFIVDPAAGPTLRTPSTPRTSDRVLVRDEFTVASPTGVGPGVALTGQAWTARLGTWLVDHNTGIIRESAGTAQSNIDIPSGSPNVEVNVWVQFKANDGITLRRVSATEYLCVYLTATDVVIAKRDPTLATLPGGSVADTHQVGRWYKLTVKIFGDRIDVYLDNVWKVGHTLSAGDAAKFITGDHGLFCSASGGLNGWMDYQVAAL